MIKRYAIIHVICIGLLLLPFWGLNADRHNLMALFYGALFGGFNTMLLLWLWRRIFAKKSIALSALLIVIKYLILISAFYWVGTSEYSPGYFVIGVSASLLALFAWSTPCFKWE